MEGELVDTNPQAVPEPVDPEPDFSAYQSSMPRHEPKRGKGAKKEDDLAKMEQNEQAVKRLSERMARALEADIISNEKK